VGFEQRIRPELQRAGALFTLTIVTTESEESLQMVAKTRVDGSLTASPLNTAWPEGVFSLSHVALPFSPDDPLYGTAEATRKSGLPLGSLNARGESGVLRISDGQLLRLRHNPFYAYTENHASDWLPHALNRKDS
jgi:hypothetical protein